MNKEKHDIEIYGRDHEAGVKFGVIKVREMYLNNFFCEIAKIIYPTQSDIFNGTEDGFMEIPNVNILWSSLKEIIKNIHDHNGGWGYADIRKKNETILAFTIGNLKNPTPHTNEHVSEKQVNFGLGLMGLKSRLNFSLDIESGYVYRGEIQYAP